MINEAGYMKYCKSGKVCHRTIKDDNVEAVTAFLVKSVQQDGGENSLSIHFFDNRDRYTQSFSIDVFRPKI